VCLLLQQAVTHSVQVSCIAHTVQLTDSVVSSKKYFIVDERDHFMCKVYSLVNEGANHTAKPRS
jgi:hypothetical protein